MKKIVSSILVAILMFFSFYPVIYATENFVQDENTIQEENKTIDNSIVEEKEKENVVNNTTTNSVENKLENTVISEPNSNVQNNNSVSQNVIETETVVSPMSTTVSVPVKASGKMWIETPENSKSYTIPDVEKIKVAGWAVSTETDAKLNVYMDGSLLGTVTNRISRPDVDSAVSPNYGGVSATPKAGFEYEVDISKLKSGNHVIKVEQISDSEEVLSTDSRTIQIKQKSFSGKMYIESPVVNKTYYLPSSNNLSIAGWAVSNDANASLKVYLDGKESKVSITRISRPDVDSAVSSKYGGTKTTPQAGFKTTVNIASLSIGNHTIKVEEISRYGSVVTSASSTFKVAQQSFKGKMYVESPNKNGVTYTLPENNNMQIKGWAVSNDPAAYMIVCVDGKQVQSTLQRTARKDVDKAVSGSYGGTSATPKAGFTLTLDISGLSQGNHTISVMEVSRFHKIMCRSDFTMKLSQTQYKGKMYVESPNKNGVTYTLPENNNMQIKGWAVSNDPAAYMIVCVDGKQVQSTLQRTARKDVDKAVSGSYGGTSATPKAGFTLTLDISGLSQGNHTISVMEVSRFHKIMCRADFDIKTSTPNYTGIMNIENPIQNKRYPSGWLKVQGWAITECSGDFVKVYLDGKYQTVAESTQRQDVLNVYKTKYPNHNVYTGFVSNINTSGLSEGTHRIKLQHCSKYGKVIEEKEVPFTISNTTTWGIDVSHYQGTIDWNAVRNSGVNFAILKIGEYRESSDVFLLDEKFNEYYSACKAHGIAVGGYVYSYEFNPTEASHEAYATLNYIKGKSFEMPIFLDLEDKIIVNAVNTGRTSVDNITNGAVTFCSIMNQNGYSAGVYASRNFYYTYLNRDILENYSIWLAHYAASTDYLGRYDLWQYTSDGSISGITGKVDLNWCYKKYY